MTGTQVSLTLWLLIAPCLVTYIAFCSFLFFLKIDFIYVSAHVIVSINYMRVGTHQGQKRALDPPELEL